MSEPAQKESLWRRWVVQPIISQLAQGTDPSKIAWAIAFGVTTGIFPLLGTTILVSLAIGIPLRLNQPVLQVFRELMYPLHLASILLFIRAGESLFGVAHTSLSLSVMVAKFGAGPGQFMSDYGMLGVYAVSVWGLLAVLLLPLVYFISKPFVAVISKKFTSSSSSYAQ